MKKLYQSIFSSKPYALLIICFLLVVKLQAQVSLIGLATPYNNTVSDYDMVENPVNSGKWSASVYLTANTVKFRLNHSNTTTWGGTDLPTGVADVGGPNFNLTSAGFYVVHFNTNNKQYSFSGDGKVGINNNTPKTALDVSGAITVRPVSVTVVSNAVTIPDNVGNVVINQGGSTGAFTISMASYTEGQRLIIDNLNPHVGTLAGSADVPATGISEFVVSDGEWKLITNNPATPSNSWKTMGNAGINAATNFLGTTDAQPLSFRINSAEKMKLVTGGLQINQSNFLEFGTGVTKETNAGKIGYALFTPQTLDIVGAGTQYDNRKIRFWAEGGSTFEGGASFAKGVGISANPIDGKLQINSSTASIASIAIKDSMTNGAGHISFRNVNNVLQGMDMKVNSTGAAGNLNNLSLNTASNIYNPSQTFYGNGHTTVAGNLTIGDDANTPVAGTMRYNNTLNDFEGYNGTEWKSLTKARTGWGNAVTIIEVQPNYQDSAHLGDFCAFKGDYGISAGGNDNGLNLFWADTVFFYKKTAANWASTGQYIPDNVLMTGIGSWKTALAINNDYAIIAKPNYSNTATKEGKVAIYKRVGNLWVLDTYIYNPAPINNSQFGASVSISSTNTLVIGAPFANPIGGGQTSGKIYIYQKVGASWVLQQQIVDVSVKTLGFDVAIDGNYFISGVPETEFYSGQIGGAVVYFFNGISWVKDAELVPQIGTNYTNVGKSVSISGNAFAISGNKASRIWRRTGISYAEEYTFPTIGDDEQRLCAISGNTCVILSNEYSDPNIKIYEKTTTWNLVLTIPSGGEFFDLSVEGNSILIPGFSIYNKNSF